MIVRCPNCATGFALPEAELGQTGRKVRCAACGHVWLQRTETAPTMDSPAAMEPAGTAMRHAPGYLPKDLLEIDSPVGLVGIGVYAWDNGNGEADKAESVAVPSPDSAEESSGEAVVAPAVEQAAPPPEAELPPTQAANEAEEKEKPITPAETNNPAMDDPVPAAWRAPGLAALAPLVNAIARDEAKKPLADRIFASPPVPSLASAKAAGTDGIKTDNAGASTLEAPGTPRSVAAASPAPSDAVLAETVPMAAQTILLPAGGERAKESDAEDQIETTPPQPAGTDTDLAPERDLSIEIAEAALRHRRLRIGAIAAALALVVGGLIANEAMQQDRAALLAAIVPGGAETEQGLGFANVNTQRTALDGEQVLVVTGEVVNTSRRAVPVPALRGALLGGERELQYWTFSASAGRLDPGQRTGFETVLRNPAAGATDLRVTFTPAGG